MPQAERRVFGDRPFTLLLSPSGKLRDVTAFFAGFVYSLGQLWGPLMEWRIDREATDFAVPVFFFIGDQDLQSPTELVTAYAPTVRAPTSALVTFPGAAHFAFVTHGEAFLHELVTRVRPLAEERDESGQHRLSGEGPRR
jgi:pimeloyl-ACP methyl ester carboxylesterase